MSAARNNGPQAHGTTRESVGATLFAIDDAIAFEHSRPASHTHRPPRRPPARDDVLEENTLLRERTLETVGRPCSFACPRTMTNGNPDAGSAGGGEQHGAELGSGEPRSVGINTRHSLREAGADLARQLRVCREAVLVEVERRSPPRPEHEIPFEVRAARGSPASALRRACGACGGDAGNGERFAGMTQQCERLGRAVLERRHRPS